MELSKILPALTLLLPGVISLYFIDRIEQSKKKERDATERLVYILISGIIPSICSILLLNILFGEANSISDAANNMNRISYLLLFILFGTLLSYIWAIIFVKAIRPFAYYVINDTRKGRKLSKLKNESVWGQFFDSEENSIVYVYHISNPTQGTWGIINSTSEPHEEDRDIRLIGSKEIKKKKHKLKVVKDTFIDAKTGIVVESYEYDIGYLSNDEEVE
jgi:hypothetical protein